MPKLKVGDIVKIKNCGPYWEETLVIVLRAQDYKSYFGRIIASKAREHGAEVLFHRDNAELVCHAEGVDAK